MNVLMLSGEYPPHLVGGLGAHVAQLAPVLARKGAAVHLVTPRLAGGAEEEVVAEHLHVSRVEGHPGSGADFIEDTDALNSFLYGRAAAMVATQPGPWLV
ncbi:MAG: glycogen/starch synthase, partial [Chloroflexota bacterium]